MNFDFYCPKKEISQKKTSFIRIFFHNGDCVELRKREIVNIDLRLYDQLQQSGSEFSPVAESGFVQLQVSPDKERYECTHLYNCKEHKGNRKELIENRCLEGGISHIAFHDANNWHLAVYGEIKATQEDSFLFLRYFPKKSFGTCDGKNHYIRLSTPRKKNISGIDFSFENCDFFDVYQGEIVDVQLQFSRRLVWNSSGFARKIRSGFIQLKLDNNHPNRDVYLIGSKKRTVKQLCERLCGKGIDDTDICHLRVTYDYPGGGVFYKEYIKAPQIITDDYDEEEWLPFVSGYAKKQADGSILIVFGKEKQG